VGVLRFVFTPTPWERREGSVITGARTREQQKHAREHAQQSTHAAEHARRGLGACTRGLTREQQRTYAHGVSRESEQERIISTAYAGVCCRARFQACEGAAAPSQSMSTRAPARRGQAEHAREQQRTGTAEHARIRACTGAGKGSSLARGVSRGPPRARGPPRSPHETVRVSPRSYAGGAPTVRDSLLPWCRACPDLPDGVAGWTVRPLGARNGTDLQSGLRHFH
jgi:hypothetical protein